MHNLFINTALMVKSVVVVTIAIFLYGSFLHAGNTYTKVRLPNSTCEHALLIAEIQDSEMCCDSTFHHFDWACVGAYDDVTTVMSSWGSWVFPAIPTLLTTIIDMIVVQKVHFRTLRNRLLFFLGLFVFRTVS